MKTQPRTRRRANATKEGRSLTISLRDGSGRPLRVAATVIAKDAPSAVANGRVRYRARGRAGEVSEFVAVLPQGEYVVEASAPGLVPASYGISLAEDSVVDLTLYPSERDDGKELDEGDAIDGRLRWFVEQRVGPEAEFPVGARLAALERKRVMDDPEFTNIGLSIRSVENPLPRSSFGSIERYVRVGMRDRGPDRARLLKIGYEPEDLGWVDEQTLRLFRFDQRRKTFVLVPMSGVDVEKRYVYGYIDQSGVYGLIGLPGDPALLDTVQSFCRFVTDFGVKPELQNRICELILCASRGQERFGDPPGGIGGNACDYCLTLQPVGRLPECDLLPMPPPGPIQPGCNWLCVGPRNINGRVRALAVHPADGSALFAGTANAGVWKTTDTGQSWTALMHDEGALEIGALVVHLSDPAQPAGSTTIYAGTGEPTSWPGYRGVGILKSTASGAPGSWVPTGSLPAPGNDRFSAIVVDPSSVTANPSTTILYAGGTPGGLYRSADGGATWTSMLAKNITGIALDPTNPAIVYAAVAFEGIYRYDPVAATWSLFNTGLVSTPQLILIAIGQSAPHTMYAKLDETVYRYDTVAASWQSLGDHGGTTYGYWNNVLAVDPADSNIVFAGGIGFERSSDGGTTWSGVPGLHSDQHALAFDSTSHLNVYVGNDGGVFRGTYPSPNSAGSWVKVSDGLIATAFNQLAAFPTWEIMGGGTQDNGTNRTVGGLTWDNIYGADGGFLVIDPQNPYVMWAEIQYGGGLGKTTDGAATWVGASSGFPGGPWVTPLVIDPTSLADPSRVLFAGGNDGVYRSSTSGASWTRSSPALGAIQAIALAPSSAAVVYAGTDAGRVWRSSDGGLTTANWKDVSVGTLAGSAALPFRSLTDLAPSPASPDVVYATYSGFGGGHVFRGQSGDGWATFRWDDVSANLPDIPVNAIQVDPVDASIIYIGTDVGVFRSVDGGLSWSDFGAGFPNVVVSDLLIDAAGEKLRAATYGYGVWEIQLRSACTPVDVYVRDNVVDNGQIVPSPSGVANPEVSGANVYWWESADIKVDAYPYFPVDALFDGVEFDLAVAEDVVRNDLFHPNPNRLYAQVHNRGPNAAHNVKVKVLYADASAGLPQLPNDFWTAFPNDWAGASAWSTVDPAVPYQTVPVLLPHTPRVLSWSWTVPTTAAGHTCMLMVVSADEDPVTRSDAVSNDHLVWMVVPNDKHVTLRNLHVISAPGPFGWPPFVARVDLHNALRHPAYFDLELDRRGLPPRTRLSVLFSRTEAKGAARNGKGNLIGVTGDEWWWRETRGVLKKRGWKHHWRADVGAREGGRVRLPAVLLPAQSKLEAVVIVDLPRTSKPGDRARLTLTQWLNKAIVGGSTFEYRIPPRPLSNNGGEPRSS